MTPKDVLRIDNDVEFTQLLQEFIASSELAKPLAPEGSGSQPRVERRRTPGTRSGAATESVLFLGALAIWPNRQRAEWNGKPLDLTSMEFQLLGTLANAGARPVSKQELAIRALGRPYTATDRHIDLEMNKVSSKLHLATNGQAYIQPVPRQCYQLVRG
jgi:DNA-binding response OmpR family regulator